MRRRVLDGTIGLMAWGPTTGEASARLRLVLGRDTRPEVIVRQLAHGMGYRFRLHRRDLPGRPDLVFPGRRKVVFVHGCFWHRHDCLAGRSTPSSNVALWRDKFSRTVARDRSALKALQGLGWGALVVWECEVASPGLNKRLSRFLDGGGATAGAPHGHTTQQLR